MSPLGFILQGWDNPKLKLLDVVGLKTPVVEGLNLGTITGPQAALS